MAAVYLDPTASVNTGPLTLRVSTSCPLPRPERLEIGRAMRLNQVTRLLPAELFSHKLFKGSREGGVKKSFFWIVIYVSIAV